MRRVWVFIVASLLLALAIPALAQTYDWECYYDFAIDDYGWVGNGSFADMVRNGDGWNSQFDDILGTYFVAIDMGSGFFRADTAPVSVTYFELQHTMTPGPSPLGTSFISSDAGNLGSWGNPNDIPEPFVYTTPHDTDSYNIRFLANFNTNAGSAFIRTLILKGEGDGPDECPGEDEEDTELTRPLQPTERTIAFQSIEAISSELSLTLANEAVIFGAEKDALVSAVIDGVVTQIEPLTPDLCEDLFDPTHDPDIGDTLARNCRVTLVGGFADAGDFVELFDPTNNPAPAYVVHILGSDDREYLQIVTHPDEYVFEGQTITAGCWLGRALSIPGNSSGTIGTIVGLFSPIAGALIQVFGGESEPFEALTSVWVLDASVYVNAWDEYVLEPSDSAPCNTPEGYEGCMGDSRLEDPSEWQSSNGVSWTDPGALMPTNSYIEATFNLNAERDPIAIIGAAAQPLGVLALDFGTTNQPVNYVLGVTELEIAAGDPDEGEFYTLRIENVGEQPIRLDFICVLHELDRTGSPAPRPPVTTTTICYFVDSSFENGLDEWDISGDVEEDDGAVLIPDDDSIEQELELTTGTYTLKVVTEVWGTGAYEPDDENETGGIQIEYAYPATTFVSMGTKTWATYSHRTQTFTAEIIIASDEDGTFTLRPNITSAPTGVLGVRINSACLTKEGEVPAGEGDGLITPSCGTIATPTLSATQPGTWTTWLWAQLNKFYRCELIKVLNSILTVMTNFFRTSLWNIRWTQAAVIRFGNFTSSGFYWLNGHLHNIAVGRVYVVEGGTGYDSAGDIGDVILGGLKSVIDLFISLLQRVIDFVFYLLNLVFQIALAIVVALIRLAVVLIGMIIGVLGEFFDLINALFFAWNNSTAAPIAGLPQCAVEPKEAPVCIFLWVLENTIFSGRGFLFIPFIVAYGSAELLLWAVAKFSKRIEETGQSG